jgi:hypothetical protein
MQAHGNSTNELSWPRVALAGLLPAAVGLVAASTGRVPELRDIGVLTLMALVFALVDMASQTGPYTLRRHPHLLRLGAAVVLLFGLVTSGAVGPR